MSGDTWYVDTSALVKTVIAEAESPVLLDWLRNLRAEQGHQSRSVLASCALTRVEAVRAVRLSDPEAVHDARRAIATLTLLSVDDELLTAAADLQPSGLRSLDAIHLAAAFRLGQNLAGVVTYDHRMADSAERLGLTVVAPGP